MFAHVTTFRLGSADEVEDDMTSPIISDQTARTIASWWHSPGRLSANITALSHGRPFDTEGLREELHREAAQARQMAEVAHLYALLDWLDNLEEVLSA